MRKETKIGLLLAVLFGLSACTKELDEYPVPKGMVAVCLSLPDAPRSRATEEGTSKENEINDVTVLFYNQANLLVASAKTGTDKVRLDKDKATVLIPINLIPLTNNYNLVVLANTTGKILKNFTPTVGQAKNELDKALSQNTSLVRPNDNLWLMMSGSKDNHSFSANTIAEVPLKRMMVKFRINLLFDRNFLLDNPNVHFDNDAVGQEYACTTNNVPDHSFLFGDPDAARFNTLFNNSINMKLVNYDTVRFKMNEADVLSTVVYGFENVVSGKTETDRKRATNFSLQLPYRQDGKASIIKDNYYKILIEDTNNGDLCYQTLRNHLYHITVTIKGFGGDVPQIDGVDVMTHVLPWNSVSNNIDIPESESVELTNTDCRIYGDMTKGCVIAQAKLNQKGLKVTGTLTTTAPNTDFEIVNKDVTFTDNAPVDIKINTFKPFTNKVVTLTVGGKAYPITVSAQFDEDYTIKNANLKTIPTGGFVTATMNGPDLFLYTSKVSLGDVTRISECFCTTTDLPQNSVMKVVIVQEPYVLVGNTKWATGNLSIGKHPFTDNLCYVIGSACEPGLWFRFNQFYGYEYEAENGREWNELASRYYVPSKQGSFVKADLGTEYDWTTIWDADLGAARVAGVERDPCAYVKTSNPAVKWRTPTQVELNALVAGASWSNEGNGRKGLLTTTGLFLRCAGGRNGGRTGSYPTYVKGVIRWVENATGGGGDNIPTAAYWSSTTNQDGSAPGTQMGIALTATQGNCGNIGNRIMDTANSIRCVRAN